MPLFLLLLAAATDAAPNPLAPALLGKLECSSPDDQRKTCRSIASYDAEEGDTYSNAAEIIVSPDGPVVLQMTAPVTVKGQSVCGTLKPEALAAAKLRIAGTLLDDDEAAPILARMTTAMGKMMNKEICITYQTTPTGLVQKATIDGVYDPKQDRPVEWIAPDAGYVVAP